LVEGKVSGMRPGVNPVREAVDVHNEGLDPCDAARPPAIWWTTAHNEARQAVSEPLPQ
jgi:hypothetical protein